MRTLALQGFLVAAVAIAATGGTPVPDEGQTKSSETISIPVLLNDPAGTALLGVVNSSGATVSSATLPSGATVSVSGDQISYNPNGNLPADGTDEFSYNTNCGVGSVVVAITPGVQPGGNIDVTAPQNDTAVTRPNTPVRIDVLRNDPQDSLITGIISGGTSMPLPVALPSGAMLALDVSNPAFGISGGNDALTYTPPVGAGLAANFTDTFQYTTQGGTATVTVLVSASAATPTGPPVDDAALTSSDQPVTIDVLENDPRGSLLLDVCSPSNGRPDNGTVRINGNKVIFTPDPNRSTTPPYNVDFCYQTNGGTGTISVNVGGISGGLNLAQIQLQNATRFQITFRVTSDPGVFFDECNTSMPLGFEGIAPGDPTAMTPVIQVEPMAGATLCVGLSSIISTRVSFTAETGFTGTLIQGNRTGQTTCNGFTLFPGGSVRAVRVEEVLGNPDPITMIRPVIGIQINCGVAPL